MESKNNKKQKWTKPKLTILIKSLTEENVLAPCVSQGCRDADGKPSVGLGGVS